MTPFAGLFVPVRQSMRQSRTTGRADARRSSGIGLRTVEFVAYHDRTSADHQAHFDDLFPKGWRITSLSVYGARGNERYAAVWVKRPGPDWSAVHGVNGSGYQTAFRQRRRRRFQAPLARGDRAAERSGVRRHVPARAGSGAADSIRARAWIGERSGDDRSLDRAEVVLDESIEAEKTKTPPSATRAPIHLR